MSTQPIIKGSLIAIILKLLDENGRMYGYEMTRAVEQKTKGQMAITEAALYPALHKLEADGVVQTEVEKKDGRLRKYYSLTTKGKKETKSEIDALQQAIQNLQLLLAPKLNYHG